MSRHFTPEEKHKLDEIIAAAKAGQLRLVKLRHWKTKKELTSLHLLNQHGEPRCHAALFDGDDATAWRAIAYSDIG